MITDASGKRIGGDGPSGREVHLIEIIKDGKPSWALAPVGGGFDKLEVAAILNQAALGIVTQVRLEVMDIKTKQAVQSAIKE